MIIPKCYFCEIPCTIIVLIEGILSGTKTKMVSAMEWVEKKSYFNGFFKIMEKMKIERPVTVKKLEKVSLCPSCAEISMIGHMFEPTENYFKDNIVAITDLAQSQRIVKSFEEQAN